MDRRGSTEKVGYRRRIQGSSHAHSHIERRAPRAGHAIVDDRAEAVLHLRCVLINELWDDFERFLGDRHVRLAAQPVPTRTHDTVVKKAA